MVLHLCQVSSVQLHAIHLFPILLQALLALAALIITVGPLRAANTVRLLQYQLIDFSGCSWYVILATSTERGCVSVEN